jgi:hypothetical protein
MLMLLLVLGTTLFTWIENNDGNKANGKNGKMCYETQA